MNKQAVSEAYFSKGAKLINAHGLLATGNNIIKTVPPKTVLYFLGRPGYCLHIPTTLGVQDEYFTSKKKLFDFMYRSGDKNNISYVSNAQSKMKVPGNKYINLDLKITPDKEYPTMGYIKHLPTKYSHEFLNYKNIVPVRPGWYRLSELIKDGGVFIVSSCQQIPNNTKNRFDENPYGKATIPRGTPWSKYIIEEKVKPLRKGHYMKNPVSLKPKKNFDATKVRYPPETLKKLREEILKGGNLLETLENVGARANLRVRKPGEYELLKRLVANRTENKKKIVKLRSGLTYRRGVS
jgi:hypothetical protein